MTASDSDASIAVDLITSQVGNHGVVLHGRTLTLRGRREIERLQVSVGAWCEAHVENVALVVPNLLSEIDDIDQVCLLGTAVAVAAEGKRPSVIAKSHFEGEIITPAGVWDLANALDDDEPRLYLVPSGWCGVELACGSLDEEAVEEHQVFGDDDEPTGELEMDDWDEGSIDGETIAMVSSEDTDCFVELDADAQAKLGGSDEGTILMHCYPI